MLSKPHSKIIDVHLKVFYLQHDFVYEVVCNFIVISAQRDVGAWLNDRAIRTSECNHLSRALIGTGFPYAAEARVVLVERLRRVLGHCRDIRRVGSAAIDLCWVAMGRLDGFYEALKP